MCPPCSTLGHKNENEPSIEYLELFAVVVGAYNWLHCYKNRQIILFCDNQSVVHMINKTTSSCGNCLILIRHLVLLSLKLNIRVFATYIRSKDNKSSDLLSRLKLNHFKKQKAMWDPQLTQIPAQLWPLEKIWRKY